jgi:predicted nucleotidyltransferase
MSRRDPTALGVTTLAERKANEAKRRAEAAEAVVGALRDHARDHGGRYVVFGSYASGTMRHDSDLDILIDFPPERAADAWLFAEDACATNALPPDLHDARTTTSAFRDRVLSRGLVLS